MTKKKIEKDKEWIVDWKQTLYENALWIPISILVFSVIFIALNKVKYFTDQGFQLMYLVFCLFFIFKILHWLGKPILNLKLKNEM